MVEQTGIIFDLVNSGGKVGRYGFGQQELCLTLFLVVGKLFDLIFGNRNYVRPCF